MTKRINESNSNRIVNKLGQNSTDSDLIHFVKRIEISGFEFDSFIKRLFGLIRLIHLVELINESNRIRIRLLFVYPIRIHNESNRIESGFVYDSFTICLENIINKQN